MGAGVAAAAAEAPHQLADEGDRGRDEAEDEEREEGRDAAQAQGGVVDAGVLLLSGVHPELREAALVQPRDHLAQAPHQVGTCKVPGARANSQLYCRVTTNRD